MNKHYIFFILVACAGELRASQAPGAPVQLKRRTSLGEIKKRQAKMNFSSLAIPTVEKRYERLMDTVATAWSNQHVPQVLERTKELLAASPKPQDLLNKKEQFTGRNLLMILIYKGYHDAAAYVASQDGIDLEAQANSNKEKDTALIYAGKWGTPEVAHILLKKGANVHHQDGFGWTAQDWARTMNNVAVAEVFKNHGKLLMIEEELKDNSDLP